MLLDSPINLIDKLMCQARHHVNKMIEYLIKNFMADIIELGISTFTRKVVETNMSNFKMIDYDEKSAQISSILTNGELMDVSAEIMTKQLQELIELEFQG